MTEGREQQGFKLNVTIKQQLHYHDYLACHLRNHGGPKYRSGFIRLRGARHKVANTGIMTLDAVTVTIQKVKSSINEP